GGCGKAQLAAEHALGGDPRTGPCPQRPRRPAGTDTRPDGDLLGASRPRTTHGHHRTRGGLLRRTTRTEPGGPRRPRLQRRGTPTHRHLGGGLRHQHLGRRHRLTPGLSPTHGVDAAVEPIFGTQGTGKTLDRALTAIFGGYRCRTPTTVLARGRPGPCVLNIPSAPRRGPMRSLHPDDPEYLGGFRLVAHLGSNTAGTVHLGVDGDGHPAAVTAVRPECVT